MITLRCTASLLKHIGAPSNEAPPTGALGDWYAKPIVYRPRRLALCTNEHSFLSVVVPIAPATRFLERFVAAAQRRINQIPVDAALRLREMGALGHIGVGRTANRSVLSTMTQLALDAEAYLDSDGPEDLEALGQRLCDTPCSALSTTWPWVEAELCLAASVAPGRRGLRSPRSVI